MIIDLHRFEFWKFQLLQPRIESSRTHPKNTHTHLCGICTQVSFSLPPSLDQQSSHPLFASLFFIHGHHKGKLVLWADIHQILYKNFKKIWTIIHLTRATDSIQNKRQFDWLYGKCSTGSSPVAYGHRQAEPSWAKLSQNKAKQLATKWQNQNQAQHRGKKKDCLYYYSFC